MNKRVLPLNASDVVANQKVVGRVAVDLVERSDSPYLDGGRPEIVRYVIDDVELSTNEIGEISARVLPNAEMHIYGSNAAGTEARATLPVQTDAVNMLLMERVPDNYGDDTSIVLLLDFEKAFSQAGDTLDALENVRGHFNMYVTLSSVQQFVRPEAGTGDSALPRKVLIGESITVNDQSAVTGGGFVGHAWIRSYDPDPPPDPGYATDSGSTTDTTTEPVSGSESGTT